jgi:hypothetical protein
MSSRSWHGNTGRRLLPTDADLCSCHLFSPSMTHPTQVMRRGQTSEVVVLSMSINISL